jgi:hypothetical protein
LAFTIGDQETAASNLVISATSSNLTLVPVPNVIFSGSGNNRTVTVTPAANQFGTSLITVTLDDGASSNHFASQSFLVTVNPVNDPPTLDPIANVIISNAGPQTVRLTGITSGAANENQVLTVTASSSNPGLISNIDVSYTSPATTGTLIFTPVAHAVGTATITVTVSDGALPNIGAVIVTLSDAVLFKPDLYMQDTPDDTGVEPNPDTGPMYVSEDIWVRQEAISGYTAEPFDDGSEPDWLKALGASPHQSPIYRNPLLSRPNFVYVRVRNRGNLFSSGNARLRVYWAKASTGLSWPAQWVDYVSTACGTEKLYGREITKCRSNVAHVTSTERTKLLNAILDIGAATFGDKVSYWFKQDEIHQATHVHDQMNFLPWHRELVNRFEVMLQQSDPTVMLHYWDWTENPTAASDGAGGSVNLFTSTFMGSAFHRAGSPFDFFDNGLDFHGDVICSGARQGLSYLDCSTWDCGTSSDPADPPLIVVRYVSSGTPLVDSDETITDQTDFVSFHNTMQTAHGIGHGFIGGTIGCPHTAFEDPFVFLLHSDVDRLFAGWQRNVSDLSRLDPTLVYGDELSEHEDILETLQPWGGGDAENPAIYPWTTDGGQIVVKDSKDPSVVSPPFYDTAPLVVPVLQPGQSVVLQIPWYPPNPASFSCFDDDGQVCLLARIETSASEPFGMTDPEIKDIYANVKNNNNIVLRQVTIFRLVGAFLVGSVVARNVFDDPLVTRFNIPPPLASNLFNYGDLYLDLGSAMFDLWRAGGSVGRNVEPAGGTLLKVLSADAFAGNIRLAPGQTERVGVQLRLHRDYPSPAGQVFYVDLEQRGVPGSPTGFVGGQRFVFDFNELKLVAAGANWRYWDRGELPAANWSSPDYNDTNWPSGAAELGFGDKPATTVRSGPAGAVNVTTWFRHEFQIEDPTFYRNLWLRLKADDGAVVYLNGTEIFRLRLPPGVPITPDTLASTLAEGATETAFFPAAVSGAIPLLRQGHNVIAVEVHQNARTSTDLRFDLELCGNVTSSNSPPVVVFTAPANHSWHLLGQNINLNADAVDPDGTIAAVEFYADGQLIGRDTNAPYTAVWANAPAGRHALMAVAIEASAGTPLKGSAFLAVVVASNLPPSVAITSPMSGARFEAGQPISVTATATDNTSVARVDFYLRPRS